MWEYKGKVTRVIDGDTLEVLVDLGFHVYTSQHIRILDLNSPEKNTDAGKEALAYANKLFSELTPDIIVRTEYDRSFARFLGHVTLSDGSDYAAVMKAAGYGV